MTLDRLEGIVLIGAGRMGGALLEGWIAHQLNPSAITVLDPAPAEAVRAKAEPQGVRFVSDGTGLDRASIIILAVKPQIMGGVMANLGAIADGDTLALSIAAGQTIGDIESGLGHGGAVVRAMPNTPAAIGHGMTVLVANGATSDAQRAAAEGLMQSVGVVEWVEDEALMDAVTAVSGSGPAYVFHLAECLAEAGVAAGLDQRLAARLAQETIAGAGALVAAASEAPSTLRENVTSPGGTTEAALKVLMAEDGLAQLMRRAVMAATRRGRELAG
ncbi:MAG: pyrroline-5-carboxylate reductase [Rhizobiales bacterium]|nr:pyrroline-5-carboxylate reductase [Hyphomicrobiales bacterium]